MSTGPDLPTQAHPETSSDEPLDLPVEAPAAVSTDKSPDRSTEAPTRGPTEAPTQVPTDEISAPSTEIHPSPPADHTTPTPSTTLPLILTVEETAALLRINRKTVYDLVRRDQLPGARKLGRALRFHRDALLRWMRAEPPHR